MTGNLNRPSNLDSARAAWGALLPGWIETLANACDRTTQKQVAERLGKSGGYVSRIINRVYAGSYDEAEKQVRAVLGAERVMCPRWGDEIPLKVCINHRRRRQIRTAEHAEYARWCPGCANNTDTEEEE